MGIVIGFLPIVLWLVAVIMAVAIITFTIGRGHIFTPRAKRPATEPVDWSMVKMHFLSFVMALIPFPIFVFLADSMDVRLRDFCDAAQSSYSFWCCWRTSPCISRRATLRRLQWIGVLVPLYVRTTMTLESDNVRYVRLVILDKDSVACIN